MSAPSGSQRESWAHYAHLFGEIWARTHRPLQQPSFVMYFLVVMIVISPLNVWVEWYAYAMPASSGNSDETPFTNSSLLGLRTALLTFFPAVAAGTAMQLVWAQKNKAMRAFAILTFTCLAAVTAFITPARISDEIALRVGIVATVVSLWLWWIANARQADLLDKLDPDAPVGGENPHAPLPGDLVGFNH